MIPIEQLPLYAAAEKICRFSCPKRWESVVRRLHAELDLLGDVRVVQVKTKWGYLCVYVENPTEATEDYIRKAEEDCIAIDKRLRHGGNR